MAANSLASAPAVDAATQQSECELVVRNLAQVQEKLAKASVDASQTALPTLVAVSKTKPTFLIRALYNIGHRHFGENYVQELVEKSNELATSCPDIKWHFIGHLQSNKVKEIKSVANLFAIETVDNEKLARKLSAAFADATLKPLVFIQVNTSGEDAKSGVSPDECIALAQLVRELPNLRLAGLMTIGAPENGAKDFQCLRACRERVAQALSVAVDSLQLSMGMSADYVEAIACGSTNVRVGSTIFGHRDYSK